MAEEVKDERQEDEEQDEVVTVSKAEYDAIIAERDELLQYKPVEPTEEEKAFATKQEELWAKEVALTLKENGLERFADVIQVKDTEELNKTIEILNDVMDEIKVENAYVPTDHARTSQYDTAKQKGDTQGMLKSLFGFK